MSLCAKVTLWPIIIRRKVAIVINPSPPMYIMASMINWPVLVQYKDVSSMVSPVTVIAEVAVNSAVRGGVKLPDVFVKEGISSAVPKPMAPINTYMNKRGVALKREVTRREGTVSLIGLTVLEGGSLLDMILTLNTFLGARPDSELSLESEFRL